MTDLPKTLARSATHRMVGGVLGGAAEYMGLSPAVVRLLFVVVSIFSSAFPGLIVYGLLWLVLPKANAGPVGHPSFDPLLDVR